MWLQNVIAFKDINQSLTSAFRYSVVNISIEVNVSESQQTNDSCVKPTGLLLVCIYGYDIFDKEPKKTWGLNNVKDTIPCVWFFVFFFSLLSSKCCLTFTMNGFSPEKTQNAEIKIYEWSHGGAWDLAGILHG